MSTGLSPAEAERLALLIEECGETIQAASKILRHGYESFNPDLPPPAGETNRGNLEREIGDVLVAIDFLLDAEDVNIHRIEDRKRVKRHRVWQYLRHQR